MCIYIYILEREREKAPVSGRDNVGHHLACHAHRGKFAARLYVGVRLRRVRIICGRSLVAK